MKNIMFASFLFGIFIFLSGCASTSITSFTDPDYRAVQFKKILVAANTNKVSDRLNMENRIVEVLATNGLKSIPSYSIFPPTREFTDSLKKVLMIESKIDGCLMIYFGDRGIDQVQIPVIGSSTKGTVNKNNNGATFSSLTTFIGGQVLDKPYAEFEIKLFDVVNGKTAWIANSFTGGNAYADFNDVYESFCDKVIYKLSKDNLIRTSDDLTEINGQEISRILKAREEKPEIDKIDVTVLNNGDIITGIILSQYFSNTNYGETNSNKIMVKIQDINQIIHRILLKDIREVYQK
ncbi:hypothetical protein [Clostridium sp.]|uniref:hypothetical protein n=1 Tax=Clostridium sp. TaxID=1506 RepID=UPI00283FB2BA|nr:hypothetical protein [Clostridium sp.]MDR3598783.1 hypothetical protein [Clostridium sp.]